MFSYNKTGTITTKLNSNPLMHYPMKYKTFLFLTLCFFYSEVGFSEDERLMGFSNIAWGMSSDELISAFRGQLDYKTYQTPEIYEVHNMSTMQSIFSNLKNYHRNINTISPLLDILYSKAIAGDNFPSNPNNRQLRELYFPGIFQVFGIAVNPLNLLPPLSLVMVLPKDELDSVENTAPYSPKIFVFIFYKNKLIGSMWTAKRIKNSNLLWEATLKKYGDPEKYFVLTEYHKSGGSGVSYVFASYPRNGVCVQLSFKTYDSSVLKSELTLSQRYQNGDFTDFGKRQTISIKKECFNFSREPDRAIISYFYWDTKVVDTINSEFFNFKKQLSDNRNVQENIKAYDRANDF